MYQKNLQRNLIIFKKFKLWFPPIRYANEIFAKANQKVQLF